MASLEGAPRTVGGNFSCYDNKITSLIGAPQTVEGDFDCGRNQLTSLEGAPETVGVDFRCSLNQLTNLKGGPRTVGRDFYCSNNPLTSLEGAPQNLGKNFYCDEFVIKWTLEKKLEVLKEGSAEDKALIATAISPEALQQQIDENPIGMAVDLKGVWKTLKRIPGYEKLKFPPEYSEEAETLSDLEDIGL
jgi:hypothetical protein